MVVRLFDCPKLPTDYDISVRLSGPGLEKDIPLEKVSSTCTSSDPKGEYTLPAAQRKHIQKWWPIGYGQQPLYTVTTSLLYKGIVVESETRRVGFRSIEVVQHKLEDQEGTSFFFRVNGIPVFMAGSNWIPGDSFPSRMTPERYKKWLGLLLNGGQNAIRVWGGGYYEKDIFYDLCDELGILVWQDFMFACGAYPADVEAWRKSVAIEAEQQVRRLASHACLAILAGK